MPMNTSSPTPSELVRKASRARGSHIAQAQVPGAPLLQLHAHWQTRTHPRYLEAANFHWRY